jgi:hypothetical protein
MAALRIKQFVEAFGANGAFESICVDDFKPVLQKIADKLALHIDADLCVDVPLIDSDAATPGVQGDCVVTESVPGPGGRRETALPPCGAEPAPTCWRLVPKDSCRSGFEVVVERSHAPDADTDVGIKCRTCIRADDPRCAR